MEIENQKDPDWIRDYLMDSIVGLNHLKFNVVDRQLIPEKLERELTPGQAEDRVLDKLKLRQKGKRKGSCFAQYAEKFIDAPLSADRLMAVKRGDKIESAILGMEEQYGVSRRTVFNWLKRARERQERDTKLARKHKLLPGD